MTLIRLIKRYDEGSVSFDVVSNYISMYPSEVFATNKGRDALSYARGDAKLTKLLLDNRADPNYSYSNHFDTHLSLLAFPYPDDMQDQKNYGECGECVKLLIDAKADVNCKIKYGQTALMYAVKQQSTIITKILLEAKADPYITDNNKNNALYHALTPLCLENFPEHKFTVSVDNVKILLEIMQDDPTAIFLKKMLKDEREKTMSEVTSLMCMEHTSPIPNEMKVNIIDKI